jgi:hypothetical protein
MNGPATTLPPVQVHWIGYPQDFVIITQGPHYGCHVFGREFDLKYGKYWLRDKSGLKPFSALGFGDGLQANAVEIVHDQPTLSGSALLALMIVHAWRSGRDECTTDDLVQFFEGDALNNAQSHVSNVIWPIAEQRLTGEVSGTYARYSVAKMRSMMGEKWLAGVETKRVVIGKPRRRARSRVSCR